MNDRGLLATMALAVAAVGCAWALTMPAATVAAIPTATQASERGSATSYVPGEVIVKLRGRRERTVDLAAGVGVRRAVAKLRRDPRVAYAAPNHIATAAYIPRDTGHVRGSRGPSTAEPIEVIPPDVVPPVGTVGGWMSRQWNFLPWRIGTRLPASAGGINAIGGWQNLIKSRRPGARGITVAVVDTGIAYRSVGRRYRRNPDFHPRQFVRGFDFVRRNAFPLDRNGHGTHIAGTIAQRTDNAYGLTGLAYNARLMPVRVLDERGNGTADRIAAGIRWAADRGANVINMSFNFACGDSVPNVEAAVRHAHRRGAVLVGSVGNSYSERCISVPATLPQVIGVGGTTEGGCLGNYSLAGSGLDLVAPGGGRPVPGHDCEAAGTRPIYQVTFRRPGDWRRFGFPPRFFGTSMAAAHVSGAAAMVLASGVLGGDRSAGAVRRRLTRTARLPTMMPRLPGFGAGILDVAAATDRRVLTGQPR